MAFTVTRTFSIGMATNLFTNVEHILLYENESIFQLKRHEDGYLGIYFNIYDAQGNKIAAIKRNEPYFNKDVDKEKYDLQGTNNSYVLTEKATGRILYSVIKRRAAPNAELAVNLETYLPNGMLVKATPDGLDVEGPNRGGISMSYCSFTEVHAALRVYKDGSWEMPG